MPALIDLHAHILPNVDDGARSLADSRAMARAAAAEGVEAIAATPHVRDDYPTTAEAMEAGVEALRADFARAKIPVRVLHGGEIDLTMLARLDAATLARFTLAQSGRYLLVEFPYIGWPLRVDRQIASLLAADVTPVLAHPERNRAVQQRPERLDELARLGAVVQLTAASVDGRLGRSSRDAAFRLLANGVVDVIASDAHMPAIREAGLAAALAELRDDVLGRYLTCEAPAAIVAGEPLPNRPPTRRRRRFFSLR